MDYSYSWNQVLSLAPRCAACSFMGIELFRLAKQVDAEYDGWEAQVIATKH